MIQRIIDWYNGYTLKDKLELELLLYTAKQLAIDEMNKIDIKELQPMCCSFVTHTKSKNNRDKDLLNGEYNMQVEMLVVNVENMFYTTNDIVRQIILMKRKGSTIRVRINLETISGKKFQFCREYNVEELIKNK